MGTDGNLNLPETSKVKSENDEYNRISIMNTNLKY